MDVDWIHNVEVADQWWAVVNTVLNTKLPSQMEYTNDSVTKRRVFLVGYANCPLIERSLQPMQLG
jgi:hypothetical protein